TKSLVGFFATWFLGVESRTCPTRSSKAPSRANQPTASRLAANGMTPSSERRPCVGRKPKIPQKLAGVRTEPPVSDPRAKSTRPAATAAADPAEEPPGTRP